MDLNLGFTQTILAECRKRGLLRNETAYVLATSYHETAHTMKPIYERGKRTYFNKYERGTKIGKNLGNTQPGDGYRYRGAGFVQLTGRANFAKAGKKLGIDLIGKPELALDAYVAAQILIVGSQEGWFTGKKLSDYITLKKSDFVIVDKKGKPIDGARRIINGLDKAKEIAAIAREYDMDLKVMGYGQEKPASVPRPIMAPVAAPPLLIVPAAPQVAQQPQVVTTEVIPPPTSNAGIAALAAIIALIGALGFGAIKYLGG